MTQMLAVCGSDYGGPEKIEIQKVDIPACDDNQVKIRIHATTVNRTDCGVLTRLPKVFRLFVGFSKPRSKIFGTDFSGEIVEVGLNVTKWAKSQRVFGFSDHGLPT